MSELNIYQRMSAITSELRRVAKNLNVGAGQSSYRAVGEADVLDAVKPIEEKYGVYSYPISRKLVESEVLENEALDYKTKEKILKKQFFMRVETVYRFVNIDKPDEFLETTTYGDGMDSQDKAPGKAMTYADKYALLKGYKIVTGDDPDQHASEEITKPKYSNKPAQPTREVTDEELYKLFEIAEKAGYSKDTIFKQVKTTYKHDTPDLLKKAEYSQLLVGYQKLVKANEPKK